MASSAHCAVVLGGGVGGGVPTPQPQQSPSTSARAGTCTQELAQALAQALAVLLPRAEGPTPNPRALGRCLLVPVTGIPAGTALRHQILPSLRPRVALTGEEQLRNEVQEKFL